MGVIWEGTISLTLWIISSKNSLWIRLDFSILTTIHIALLYLSIREAKASLFLMDPSPKINTSSTKRVWVTSSEVDNLMHFISMFSFTIWIIVLNASTTRRKMKGESGHPYLMPLVGWKKLVGDQLIKIAKGVDCKQLIIHSTTSNYIPILISRNLIKFHPTLS